MKLNANQIKEVKAQGCLFNRESEDEFNVRVITKNGTMTTQELAAVSEAASRFGNGHVAFTTRLTVEIAGVPYESLKPLMAFLKTVGLETGGTGDRIRPVTSCKGTTCVFGQVDTQAIAARLHDKFYAGWRDIALPHKFKIAVGGCPNNCMKPDLNDFGLIGQNRPKVNHEICRSCKKCIVAEGCQMKAPRFEDGKITIDRELCNSCGKCIRNCYFQSLESEAHGVKVVLGGKWGRQRRPATELPGIFSEEEAWGLLEKALLAFCEYANPKERFGDMMDRVGVEKICNTVLGDEILARREEILAPRRVAPKA